MRIFPIVFEEAQKILRSVYSMELVEYPTRGTTIHSLNQSNSLKLKFQIWNLINYIIFKLIS